MSKDDKTEAVEPESSASRTRGADEPLELGEDTSEDAEQETTAEPVVTATPTRTRRSRWSLAVPIVLVVALLASAGVAAYLYFTQYRPDQETDAEAAKVAIDAASSGATALLSYSPERLEQDFAAAKDRLTGEFLNYYTQFTTQIVTPAAKEKQVKTEASVVQAALSEIQPDKATVLLFINQTTTSKENPDGAFAASSVKVGLEKVDDRWLIAAFDPV